MKALQKGKEIPDPPQPGWVFRSASMKVYTSRYRINGPTVILGGILICLIESPYKQEGKCNIEGLNQATLFVTSMKVPTKP